MANHDVYLAIQPQTGMGRAALLGIAHEMHGRLNWRLRTPATLMPADDPICSPDEVAAVIGSIQPRIAERWTGRARRRVVNISRGRDLPGATNVTCDDAAIGRLAVEHLLSKPVKALAYCGRAGDGLRRDAFEAEAEAAGCPVAFFVDLDVEAPLDEQLRRLPRPCGLFAFNDELASAAVRAATEAGLAVPQDLAVVGVDNDPVFSALSPVSLTTIDPDFRRVGREAARRLDAVFGGADPPAEPIRIPPRGLIERHSSDFVGESDALAVRAARLIRARACRGLTIDRLVEALPATYWTVNRRFQQAFGRTLKEEISRVRMAEAARLLRTTDLPMGAICERIGLENVKYFSTAFGKQMGLSPTAYRRSHGEQRARKEDD